ncbi:MAG TPA: AsmA-like C-terminal region-containing protein [Dongiaceae bacterium]|nr:AsmA-like C-terminal region-containing protein [Dongiaceae bacterium]
MPTDQRSLAGRIARGAGIAVAGLVVLLLLAAAAGAAWLSRADLKPVVERQASEALGRRVTLGSFEMRWGDPLGIEFADLAIANASWGSKPDMVRIGRFSALLDLAPLLHGVLRYQRLRVTDVTVVLERDAAGRGNWKFGSGGSGGFALVPKNRTQFPTLIDFAGQHGLITYRTRGGNVLRIALDRVAISSSGDQAPARLLAAGSYNDVALQLDATTDSYAALRDAGQPFGARLTLAGRDTDLAFDGTFREPLDFEGVRGELSIDARTLDDILGVMGSKTRADLPLSATGIFRRDGDHWALAAAKGRMMQSDFSGDLALLEGRAGAPDDLDLRLDIEALDADKVAAAFGGGKSNAPGTAMPLHPKGLDAVNLSVDLATPRLAAAGYTLRTVILQGRLAGGDVELKQLSFALGGGTLSIAGTLAGDDAGGKAALQGRLAKADMSEIARQLGGTGEEISGRLDGRARIELHGATIGDALKANAGAVVVTLRDGAVARSLIEKVSADLRSLFRSKSGNVRVSCLLGVMIVRDGIGVVSPLRLETPDAIVVGAGKLDIAGKRLELTVKTERDSTSFFALDIPIRISGPLDAITAQPLAGSDESWLAQSDAAAGVLPPDLRSMANDTGCRD